MAFELDVLRTVVGIGVLVFFGRVFATLCSRIKVPEVVGEVVAGIVFGPLALGGFIHLFGSQLIELNDLLLAFALVGGVIVLFAAGLEFTFSDFRKAGVVSFSVAGMGVVVPFLLGYGVAVAVGFDWTVAMLIGATLTATSIAVTVRVLGDLGQLRTREGSIMVNAALIDDVLGLAVLSVIVSVIQSGSVPTISSLFLVTLQAVIIWFVMLVASVYLLPRVVDPILRWKSEGTVEALAIALTFGLASLAAFLGLSPIVGAFAAGMALAGSKAVAKIRDFTGKLKMLFGPLFFAVIGTYFDVTHVLSVNFVIVFVILVVAVLGKILGCGLPAALFLRDRRKGWRVGIGMISRGEVGFIVAGLGLTAGILFEEAYSALIIVILATTIISPVMLRRSFVKQERIAE